MKTKNVAPILLAAVVVAFGACTKDGTDRTSPETGIAGVAKSEGGGIAEFPIHVRYRSRYEGQYPEQACAGGGACGSCPGSCVYISKMVLDPDRPSEGEIQDGTSRVRLILKDKLITIIPLDLPMDNGDGRTRLYAPLKADPVLAIAMGYSSVQLEPGEYEVDYSQQDPFGRVTIPANLLK